MSAVPDLELGGNTTITPFVRRAIDRAEDGTPHSRVTGGEQWYTIQAEYPLLSMSQADLLLDHANSEFGELTWTDPRNGRIYRGMYDQTPPGVATVVPYVTVTLYILAVVDG